MMAQWRRTLLAGGRGSAVLAVTALLCRPALADAVWPGSYEGRLAALAVLETLNADLLSHDSATLTLDRWCASHRLAAQPTVVAERVSGVDKPATPDQRRLLAVGSDEPIRYRRVALRCGTRVLSEADNWYVPGRLTAAMNAALDTTDIAFGRAVAALAFRRRTLAAELLWRPLPEGWDMAPADPAPNTRLDVPPAILQHRAVLLLPDGTPFSTVVETYTGALLDFPPPVPR